jgi:hypothetical protein
MAGQPVHPTVGQLGMAGGFPPEGQPMRSMVQPGQIGAPQYQGAAPVNGYNPNNWQQYVQQPQAPQGFIPPQGQPQYQHPTLPQQPWEQPGYQQPQQQRPQMQRLQMNGQEVLDGPGVPLELRGRTWGQVAQLYTQLADNYIRNNRGQPQPQQQQQQPQGQPQMQQPQQQGQPQGQPRGDFLQNNIRQAVQEVVQQELAPVTAYTHQQAVQQAQQIALAQIPDLQDIQGHMQSILRDANPQLLAQPEFWLGAADLARGRAMKERMMGGPAQPQPYGASGWQQAPSPQPQQFYGQNGQGRAVPAQQNFPQPTYSFFSEGPTPPSWGGQQQNMSDLGPHAVGMMQATGMTAEQYRAWQGGGQPQQRRGW